MVHKLVHLGTPFPGVNGDNPLTVNNLSAGQYAFIVVDNNGCEVVEEHTVDEPTLLIAEIISSTRETCLNCSRWNSNSKCNRRNYSIHLLME